jgi:MFS transporter, DHA1 family, multidrug resistance protein
MDVIKGAIMSNHNSTLRPSLWLIVLLAAITATTPLAIDMYLPAMQLIAEDLRCHISIVQQSISIFLASYAAGLLIFGPLADKLGRKHLVLIGVAGSGAASIFIAYATQIDQFLFGRMLQAFFGAMASVVVPGVIRHYYQEHTAKGLSYMSLIMLLAPMLAPSIGSGILWLSHWQTIFWVLAGYNLLLWWWVWRFFPELNIHNSQKITFLNAYKTVFAHADARPLILSIGCSAFCFFTYITSVSFVFITYYEMSTQNFALLFALNSFMLMIANFINARWVTRLGSLYMLRRALALAVLLVISLVIVNFLHLPVFFTVLFTILSLAPLLGCLAIITTNTDALILLKFPHHSGTAAGVTGTLRFGSGALAGPVLALCYTGTPLPFTLVMLSAIVAIVLCQLWYFRRERRHQKV